MTKNSNDRLVIGKTFLYSTAVGALTLMCPELDDYNSFLPKENVQFIPLLDNSNNIDDSIYIPYLKKQIIEVFASTVIDESLDIDQEIQTILEEDFWDLL
ncbi:MAG: hypothetical protein KDC92_09860 [Bacteroidetes bacterium]|nr:hypothetical protein [Bacteroidota bacterium]